MELSLSLLANLCRSSGELSLALTGRGVLVIDSSFAKLIASEIIVSSCVTDGG